MPGLDNNRGWLLYGTAVLIMVVSALGLTLLNYSQGHVASNENLWLTSKANYIAQSGAEYAMHEYYNGASSAIVSPPGIDVAGGKFTITEIGTAPNVFVEVLGSFNGGERKISFEKPDQGTCVKWNTASKTLANAGTQIQQIYFSKGCLNQVFVDQVRIDWDTPTQQILDVRFDGISQSIAAPRNSGDSMDITNYVMGSGIQHELRLTFNSDITGKNFTLQFVMSDGSLSQISF